MQIRIFIMTCLAVLALSGGCSEGGDSQVFDTQINALEKAKDAEDQIQDAVERQRQAINAIEDPSG